MSENPLKHYFRTPAIYMTLPSGVGFYPPTVVEYPENGQLPVFPMTNTDEIHVRNPDGLFSGQSMVEVIKSCIPAIKNPWAICNIDIEAIVVAIRAASMDTDMEIVSTCPACKEESKYGINLTNILAEKVNIDYSKTLDIGELSVKFRPLTYKEMNENAIKQFAIQRAFASMDSIADEAQKQKVVADTIEKINELTNTILVSSIESIKTPEATVTDPTFIDEFMTNCDSKTNKTIKDYSIALKEKNDTKPLKMKCVSCSHDYTQSLILNYADFFA